MDKFLFISGMQKCGTTALAAWLVEEGLAEYLVPGVKEPYIYMRFANPVIPNGSGSDIYRLDASVDYSKSRAVISRMPKENTKVILCFRNQWERTWSAYKMFKYRSKELDEMFRDLSIASFDRSMKDIVEKYYNAESARLQNGSFFDRTDYEMKFFYAKGRFPFLSILASGRYSYSLKNILENFSPEQVVCVNVARLDDDTVRNSFVEKFLESEKKTGKINKKFVGPDEAGLDEKKPDFSAASFDTLRGFFAYDLQEFQALFHRYQLSSEFMDFESLQRNVTSGV